MEKQKDYKNTRFTADVFQQAITTLLEVAAESDPSINPISLSVVHDDAKWTYDTYDEFYADYRKFNGEAVIHLIGKLHSLLAHIHSKYVYIAVKAPSRPSIESVFSVFENNLDRCHLKPEPD